MIKNPIVIKKTAGSRVITLLNSGEISELSSNTDVIYLYADYAESSVVKVAFVLANGVHIPYRPIFISDETVANVVPEGDIEEDYTLWEYSIPSAVLANLITKGSTETMTAFKNSEITEDTDYLGYYTTATEVDATINTELKTEYASATTGQWVNVYQTTSNVFVSWLFDGTDFIKQDDVLNEQLISTTLPLGLAINGTISSPDEEIDVTVTEIVLNEISELWAQVDALTGIGGAMLVEDYDSESTATGSVKYARNIGTDGASISYAEQLAKNALLNQSVKTTDSPEFVNITIDGTDLLDGSGTIDRSLFPDGVKVYKGDFGAVVGTDLPSSGQVTGDTYRCDSDDYTSAVSGLTYDTNDTATWNGSAWITNQSGAVDTVNSIAPDGNGNIVLKADDIDREDDSETIEESLIKTQDNIKFQDITQDSTDKWKFYFTSEDTALYANRILFARFPSTILDDTTDTNVLISIDGETTYKELLNINGGNVTTDTGFKRGRDIAFIFNSSLDGWQPLFTDKDFSLLSGVDWNVGESVSGNYSDNRVQDQLISDIINALGSGGQIVRQITDLTIPVTASSTETKLVFDTLTTASNDTSTLDVDSNNDQELNSENTAGFSLSALASVLGTQGNPNTISTVRFNCYINGSTTPCDTFDVTVGKDETVNKTKQATYVVGVGDAPDLVTIKAQLISGSADIQSFTVTVQSLFTISGGTPGPASTTTTTVNSPATESPSGTATYQQDVNEELTSIVEELGSIIPLSYVSSGQFKADRNSTLETNNFFSFDFGTTSDSDNVEISLDNGTTYYDLLKNGNSIQANDMSGKQEMIYFDGTDFQILMKPSVHTATQEYPLAIQSSAVQPTDKSPFMAKDGKEYGATRNQLVVDGDDFATSWSILLATGSVTNGVYSFTATTTNGRIFQQHFDTTSKLLYLSMVKSDSTEVGIGETATLLTAHSGSGNYELLTAIPTETNGYCSVVDKRTSGFTQIDVAWYMVINVDEDTLNGLTDQEIIDKYSTMPYFEGLQSFDNPTVTATNKNLLPLDTIEQGSLNTLTGAESSATNRVRSDFVNIELVTDYVYSTLSTSNIGIRGLFYYDVNGNFLDWQTINALQEATYESISGASKVRVLYSHTDQSTDITPEEVREATPQIELGTSATDYTAHLQSEEKYNVTLRSVNNGTTVVRDELDTMNNTLTKRVGYDFNDVVQGTTGWTIKFAQTTTQVFAKDLSSLLDYKTPDNAVITNSLLKIGDTIFQGVTNNSGGVIDTENTFFIGGVDELRIRVNKATYATSGDFEAYLQANDVTFIYELATPIITENVDQDGVALAYDDMTVEISSDSGLIGDVETKHAASVNAVIEAQGNQIRILQDEVTALEDRPTNVVTYKVLNSDSNNVSTATSAPIGQEIVLNGDIDAYDEIKFYVGQTTTDSDAVITLVSPLSSPDGGIIEFVATLGSVSKVVKQFRIERRGTTSDELYAYYAQSVTTLYDTTNTITVSTDSSLYVNKIIGIKY